jgi:DNA-binding NarL/FixJ family response regulator
MIRVFLADDQRLVRSAFAMIVDSQPDMIVVGQAANGAEAIEQVPACDPDVVLMDIRMPHVDGVEATRALAALKSKIIILTTFDTDEYAFAALRAGASGFLIKDGSPEEMLDAIRTVYRGDAVIAPSTTRRLLDQVAGRLSVDPEVVQDPLSPRERDVLRELATGASNAEIADRLDLAAGTVKIHISRILAKLELRDRIQAVIWAYEHRL